jgi:hypothetical protein
MNWNQDRYIWQAQIADLHQHPMQSGLIWEQAAEKGLTAMRMLDGEVFKPGAPVLVDVPLDPDLISLFFRVHGFAHWLKSLIVITSIEKTARFVAMQRFNFVGEFERRRYYPKV